MRTLSLMLALLLICGCTNNISAENGSLPQSAVSVSQTAKSSPAEQVIAQSEDNPQIEQNVAVTDKEKRKQLYNSNAPAKQSWMKAYQSFYSGEPIPEQQLIDRIASDERAAHGLELRSDMGIDFVYPIYDMLYSHVETVAANGSAPSAAIKCALNGGMGMLVNFKDNGSFAGEIVFGEDDILAGEFIYNGDSPPGFTSFEQGDYNNRTSLTITEGVEAQLVDFGFAPENTSAFALRFSNREYGVCFFDDEKAAYYNNTHNRRHSLKRKLYSFEELRDELHDIHDVCSLEELDVTVNPATAKPVIYLYPEKETEVTVKLGYPEEYLTYAYPAYNGGWQITAYPDGRLVNSDGSEHYYLFWEGDKAVEWDFSEGFCVAASETEIFLLEKLKAMGLTPREYNDFITYWAPELSRNAYNLITFSTEQYEKLAPLEITPEPDSVFRVHMVYKALEAPVEIKPQQLGVFERKGFSVLEWGGSRGKNFPQ